MRPDHVAGDGKTIGARLDDLVKKIAADIKECANVCNTYSKKRSLVKILKCSVWDQTLTRYIELFVSRKAEFNLMVSVHTGMAVDCMNNKLDILISR